MEVMVCEVLQLLLFGYVHCYHTTKDDKTQDDMIAYFNLVKYT
jgi:hypothetical protein